MSSQIGSKRQVTGSKHGLTDWMLQRLTACVMAFFTIALLAHLLAADDISYAWEAFFTEGWTRALGVFAWLSLSYHAWIGMRDIWMDYVKPLSVRVLLNTLTASWLIVCALYFIGIVWR